MISKSHFSMIYSLKLKIVNVGKFIIMQEVQYTYREKLPITSLGIEKTFLTNKPVRW